MNSQQTIKLKPNENENQTMNYDNIDKVFINKGIKNDFAQEETKLLNLQNEQMGVSSWCYQWDNFNFSKTF